MTAVISPPMFLQFWNPSGSGFLAGGKLFTYLSGTTTKTNTWTDSTQGVLNSNPIILDSQGACNVWLDPNVIYKFVLAPSNDTDPPLSAYRTVDAISPEITAAILTQSFIGQILYPRTSAEIAAGVTPIAYYYPPGYQARYASLADLFACGEKTLYLSGNTTTTITTSLAVPSNTRVVGYGDNSVIKAGANISLLTLSGVSNVILENFKLDGTRGTYTSSSNYGVSAPATGTGCTNIIIKGLSIVDVAGIGIAVLAQTGSHASRIFIWDNYVFNTGAHGIICQDYVDNTEIIDNHVENFAMVTSNCPGITTGRTASRHIVNDNRVICSTSAVGASTHGISMDNCTEFVCNNNTIEKTIGYGIEVGGARYGSVVGNTIVDGQRACIEVGSTSTQQSTTITISGNTLRNSADAGILTQKGSGSSVADITITGNTIQACVVGIETLDTTSDLAIVGNIIQGCSQSGIYCNVTNDVLIVGNKMKGNNSSANAAHAGIRIVNSSSETDFLIALNRVTSSGIADYTIDNQIINDGDPHKPVSASFVAADATPSVALGPPGRVFKTADTTTYTNFTNGRGELDHFYILALHAAVVTNNANIKTSTGANKTLTVNVIYHFTSVGGVWYENATV